MLFNSIDFAVFLPVVFLLYWFLAQGRLRLQNGLIVAASLLFYGWWDWRFLSLLLFSALLDYTVGRMLDRADEPRRRKLLLAVSICVNLGFLGFFKYYNFFVDNFIAAFSLFGMKLEARSLNIVLPVGISFYTFQTMSYTIDVYRRHLKPTRDLVAFMAYVSFFPQLVAGPIERAVNLLPQFYTERNFNRSAAVDGLRQMLWGFFKKMVIADTCAGYVDEIFAASDNYAGGTLLLGVIFFAFQIYCDFSGYSDIAIGLARLFGFRLMRNFAYPYFSRDIAEFWRRWHISLSTWFRDYVYIPLGGSQGGLRSRLINTFVIFLLSGFWHGANWTFIVWGALNALYFIPLLLTGRNRRHLETVAGDSSFPGAIELFQMLFTFSITVLAWVFFRAENIAHALQYIQGIFSTSGWMVPQFIHKSIFMLIGFLILLEWMGRRDQHPLEHLFTKKPAPVRWAFYLLLILSIGLFMHTGENTFIYFQF